MVNSGPSHWELVHRAAEKYSDNIDVQQGFIAGVNWEIGPCNHLGLGITIFLYLLLQIIAFIIGISECSCIMDDGVMNSKWKYVFWARNLGYYFGKWMKK